MSPPLPTRLMAGVGASLLLLASTPAAADAPLWELGLGAGVLRLPHYRGSDQQHTWLLPVPYVVYRGEVFKADRDGARAQLFHREAFRLDFSASASAPTRSLDNQARQGMADLAPTLELGPNLNWTLQRGPGWTLDLRLPVRGALTLSRDPRWLGWIATPNLNLDTHPRPGWNLGLLAGPVFGSRAQHGYFYDVPAADATATRPAYRAPGGFAGWAATGALTHRDGTRWVGAFVKFDSLGGAVFADSPLVRQRQQWSAGVAVSWVFARSAARVDQAP